MAQTNDTRVDLHIATTTKKGKTFRTEVWNAAVGVGPHHNWITYVDGERWNGNEAGGLPGKADYATARRHQKDDIANYEF